MTRVLTTLPLLPILVAALVGGGGVPAAAGPVPQDGEPEIAGAPAAFGAALEERVAVPEGTLLHEAPDPRSAALVTVDAPSELPVVERRGDWARVRYGALVGWVNPHGPPPELALDRPSAPPVSRPVSSYEEDLRAAALSWLDERLGLATGTLGEWTLRTDVTDRGLLDLLARLAADLPGVYRERYGVDPGGAEGEMVVLFAGEADYRDFSRRHAALVGIGERGHAGRRMATLFVEDRDREEVAALLVHELTHLLNARALGPRTPPWLEEGLANDLAFSEIEAPGRLVPGTLAGRSVETGRVAGAGGKAVVWTSWDGGKAAFITLIQHQERDELPPLESLASLSWQGLVDPSRRALSYAESTFFVRYLLAGDAADAFRRYLRFLAGGGGDDPAELVAILERDWRRLDRGFQRWLRASLRDHDLEDPGPEEAQELPSQDLEEAARRRASGVAGPPGR